MIVVLLSLRILVKIVTTAWKKLIAPSFGFGIDLQTLGKWAVVTGATDGLGKAFAKALAEKGMDIVLVSRSLSKLKDVAAEIERKYRVETRVVEADLTEGQVVYAEIGKATQDLEVKKYLIFHCKSRIDRNISQRNINKENRSFLREMQKGRKLPSS